MRPAEEAGLSHVIHLWSGQSTTVRKGPWRHPGLLELSLASETLTGEMIADGKHLPPTLMRLAYRSFGPDRLCLVSDATSGAGLPEGSSFPHGRDGVRSEWRGGHDARPLRLSRAARPFWTRWSAW